MKKQTIINSKFKDFGNGLVLNTETGKMIDENEGIVGHKPMFRYIGEIKPKGEL